MTLLEIVGFGQSTKKDGSPVAVLAEPRVGIWAQPAPRSAVVNRIVNFNIKLFLHGSSDIRGRSVQINLRMVTAEALGVKLNIC